MGALGWGGCRRGRRAQGREVRAGWDAGREVQAGRCGQADGSCSHPPLPILPWEPGAAPSSAARLGALPGTGRDSQAQPCTCGEAEPPPSCGKSPMGVAGGFPSAGPGQDRVRPLMEWGWAGAGAARHKPPAPTPACRAAACLCMAEAQGGSGATPAAARAGDTVPGLCCGSLQRCWAARAHRNRHGVGDTQPRPHMPPPGLETHGSSRAGGGGGSKGAHPPSSPRARSRPRAAASTCTAPARGAAGGCQPTRRSHVAKPSTPRPDTTARRLAAHAALGAPNPGSTLPPAPRTRGSHRPQGAGAPAGPPGTPRGPGRAGSQRGPEAGAWPVLGRGELSGGPCCHLWVLLHRSAGTGCANPSTQARTHRHGARLGCGTR